MSTPESPDDTPWYANRGIPLGIIVYLIALTISGTAYVTHLADRVSFLEASGPTHTEIAARLAVIETQLKLIRSHQDRSSDSSSNAK